MKEPLNVVALYPAFDVAINEMAKVWEKVCGNGAIRCHVVCGDSDKLKNAMAAKARESLPGLEIYRFSQPIGSHLEEIRSLVDRVDPSVIFSAVAHNMGLAKNLAKSKRVPIVLHTEIFKNQSFVNRRHYGGVTLLKPLAHKLHMAWHSRNAARILCSDPKDFETLTPDRHGRQLRFLPWPHPTDQRPTPLEERQASVGLYIGSMSRWKGAEILKTFYGHVLRERQDFRLLIIGPAIDEVAKDALDSLVKIGGSRVEIQKSCTRQEAQHHIGRANFLFSPTALWGWGLIGDAFNSGTPIISIAEHYVLKNQENCLVALTPQKFLQCIDQLQNEPALWERLSSAGVRCLQTHTIGGVAEVLERELLEVANDQQVFAAQSSR
jgi:glycosyltransferase involved in cell wall biosynthesis